MMIKQATQRLIVKLGTHVVVDRDGVPRQDRLLELTASCARLVEQGRQILLVSSGAVGLGSRQLAQLTAPPANLSLSEKQACAAVGQPRLMDLYRSLFAGYGLQTAQILVTAHDFSDRERYLNLRKTLEGLLTLQVIPIINENDVLSTMELDEGVYSKSFGDNDKLSALVAAKLDADLLVLLTNVEGLHEANPREQPDARRITRIESFDELKRISTTGRSLQGRGGMSAKLEAARVASISGVTTVICSGLTPDALQFLVQEWEPERWPGTVIRACSPPPKRQQWIGLVAGRFGVVRINAGASQALRSRQASLLPVGVTALEGEFQAGQVISIVDEEGHEIGRGLSSSSSRDLARIVGLRSEQARQVLGKETRQEVVHRDNLVIFHEHFGN